MILPSYFNDMLTKIRPSQDLLDQCAEAHTELRETLINDSELQDIVVTTFLQGSYRRSTLIPSCERLQTRRGCSFGDQPRTPSCGHPLRFRNASAKS